MHPTRWRRSTHFAMGIGVLAVVAIVVAAAALMTGAHRGDSEQIPDPPIAVANPGVVPVDDSARCRPSPDSPLCWLRRWPIRTSG